MMCFLTYYSKNPEKNGSKTKIKKLFTTLNNHIIMISEDHVTLKTGVMMLKIQRCITEINYISKYIKTENSYLKL